MIMSMTHLPVVVHVSVSAAADVDTSKLQMNVTVSCMLAVMKFLADKCMKSHQTGSTAPT